MDVSTPNAAAPAQAEAFPGLGLGAVAAGFPSSARDAELAVVHALIPFQRSTAIVAAARALATGIVNQVRGDPLAAALATRETVRLLEDAVSAELARRPAPPVAQPDAQRAAQDPGAQAASAEPWASEALVIEQLVGRAGRIVAALQERCRELIAGGYDPEAAMRQAGAEMTATQRALLTAAYRDAEERGG